MNRHIVIIGAQCELGQQLVRIWARRPVKITGTYSPRSGPSGRCEELCRGNPADLVMQPLDVLDRQLLERFCKETAREPHDDLVVIYSCSAWACGKLQDIDTDTLLTAVGVNLIAPFVVASSFLRTAKCPVRLILVTGLGGEKNSVAGNSVYSACVNGLYSLVHSVGRELARSRSMCAAVALGIADNKKPHVRELLSHLEVKDPPTMADVADFIDWVCFGCKIRLNGSVLELACGLGDYRDVVRWYEGGQ